MTPQLGSPAAAAWPPTAPKPVASDPRLGSVCAAGTEAGLSGESGCLLLAETVPNVRAEMERALAERGYRVVTAASVEEAARAILSETPAFAIIDYQLPDGSGLDLIPCLLSSCPWGRAVVLSRCASLRGAVAAVRLGAADFLARPATVAEIDAILCGLDDQRRSSCAPTGSLADIDRMHAEEVRRTMATNMSATARALRIDPRTLRRLLEH